MKGLTVLSLAISLLLSCLCFAADWKVNDRLEVEWKGKWYAARVLDLKEGLLEIHYEGWSSSWDEWVKPHRVRAVSLWRAGESVEVLWKERWYVAEILQVKDERFRVSYHGYDSHWDEWVGSDRIRVKQTWLRGDRVEVHWKESWYAATIIGVDGTRFKIHYEGFDASWDEWVDASRVRPPGRT